MKGWESAQRSACEQCTLRLSCIVRAISSTRPSAVTWQSKQLRQHDILYEQGSVARSLWIVRSGTVKTSFVLEGGKETVDDFRLYGDYLGLESVLGIDYATTARALEGIAACSLSFDDPKSAMTSEQSHEIVRAIGSELFLQRRARNVLREPSAANRITKFLLEWSRRRAVRKLSDHDFILPMSRSDIANYLGIAAETVSRKLVNLREVGAVSNHERSLIVRNAELLTKCIEDQNQN